MDSYQIRWKTSAQKELRKLDTKVIPQILAVVESLAQNPYPQGYKKMSGMMSTYRIRKGNYRVIYSIVQTDLVIEVIRVGHRQDVYQ